MRRQVPTDLSVKRHGERGAALITVVLLSLLMLAAGGTLILTTTMTGTTAIDSTAEMQAYYAAEAGVARTLEVVRGNVESTPTGTQATFRNILTNKNLWTVFSGNSINVAADGTTTFRVTSIVDPDDVDGIKRTASALYKPRRLAIQVAGFGPKGSRKNMEVVVDRFTLNYPVKSTVTLPNGSGDPIAFDLGMSNPTTYSGEDMDGIEPTIAAFASSNSDHNVVNNVMDGCLPDGSNCTGNGANVMPVDPLVLTPTNTPSFLQSVATAREFMYGSEGMMQAAINQGRYFTSGADALASLPGIGANHPDGAFTFVDGDFVLGPGNPTGQGTLIVTGTLTLDGNFNFNGVIMVLGAGRVLRSGGGHGNIYGAMFVAKFDRAGSSSDVFQAPTFNTNGGGTANIQYSSFQIEKAKSVGGHAVIGVREL